MDQNDQNFIPLFEKSTEEELQKQSIRTRSLWLFDEKITINLNIDQMIEKGLLSEEEYEYYEKFTAPVDAPRTYYTNYDALQVRMIEAYKSGEVESVQRDPVKIRKLGYAKPSAPWDEY